MTPLPMRSGFVLLLLLAVPIGCSAGASSDQEASPGALDSSPDDPKNPPGPGGETDPIGAAQPEAIDAVVPPNAIAGRFKVAENVADPDVLAIDDTHFLLSGTGSTVDLPFWTSPDARTWTSAGTWNPSNVDPANSYCFLWAPDLARKGDKIILHFSAHRVPKGSACPPPAGRDVTTYRSEAPVGSLAFSTPVPLFENTNGARTFSPSGCPAQGCDRAIRIDAGYDVETDRLFYVFFQGGNNIASIPLSNNGAILTHATPSSPSEEGVNEGPDIFRRNGLTYMFFSTGHFQGQYAMQYVVANDVTGLTRQRTVRRLSEPTYRSNGKLLETQGHNSVVAAGNDVWNFYHLGVFNGAGQLIRRDLYQQPIHFDANGTALSMNAIRIRWSTIPNASYSLDLVLKDGTTIGPCIHAGTIQQNSAVTFNGSCGDRLLHKSDIKTLRLYWSTNGQFQNHVDAPYDGIDDSAFIALPDGRPGRVGISWNELETGSEYSLDVKAANGTWTAPCVGANILRRDLAYEFDGNCRTPNTRVDNPATYRICSARNGDWAHARCAERPAAPGRIRIKI